MFNKSSNTKRHPKVLGNIALASLFSILLITISAVQQASAADLVRGSQLSQTCLGCYGQPGLRNPSPVYVIPMIGGQHPEYIVAALQAYKDKSRPHPTMRAQAGSLSDEDMQDIAAFFGAMGGNSRPSPADAELIALGKEKAAPCAACHGVTGDGPAPTFPKLAGQYASYLAHSLKEYRSGARANAIMNGQSQSLTIEDIEALSAYFASQDGGLSAPQAINFK